MDLFHHQAFWILLVILFVQYLIWMFIFYGHGNSKKILFTTSGYSIFFTIILSLFLLGWKGCVVLIILLVLWSFPANYFLYLIYKQILPQSKAMNYSQFKINLKQRDDEQEYLKQQQANMIKILEGSYDFSENTKLEEMAIAKMNSVLQNSNTIKIRTKYNLDANELEKIYGNLVAQTGVNFAHTVISNSIALEELLLMHLASTPSNVMIRRLNQVLGKNT